MAKISAAEVAEAWRSLNENINRTSKQKLTSIEKTLLKSYLYNDSTILEKNISEPFIRKLFDEENDESGMIKDSRFDTPAILNDTEYSYILNNYSTSNTAMSRVALMRAHLKFAKVSTGRLGLSNGQWPLRHLLLGR